MNRVNLKTFTVAAAVVLAALLTLPILSSAAEAAQNKIDLNFGSGRQGGSQYPVTVAISNVLQKLPQIKEVNIQPGGSVGNIVRVQTGRSDIAISMSSSLRDGHLGHKPFRSKTPDVLNLFTLHAFHVVLIVPQDSPIKAFKDLAGKRINVAPKGFSILVVYNELARMAGLTGKVDLGYLRITSAVENFKDGHFDGLFYAASQRMAPFINLAETRNIRLIQLDEKYLKAFVKKDPSFYITTWPKNRDVYKHLSNRVRTLAYANVVVANRKMSDKLAYAIVKAVAENFDKVRVGDPSLETFDVKNMARNVGTPFHPGALRYYRERGWIK